MQKRAEQENAVQTTPCPCVEIEDSSADRPGDGVIPSQPERRRVELRQLPMVVGRVMPARILLDHPMVSRRHAEFFADPFGRWWVRDLASRNGTLVNGAIVTEKPLVDGDRVGIGPFLLVFRLAAEFSPESIRPRNDHQQTLETFVDRENVDRRIHTLRDLASPKVSAAHLLTLSDFSLRLLETADPAARLMELCRLLIADPFHGQWAAALRLGREGADEASPQVLAEVRGKTLAQSPHVSRNVLRAVTAKGEAVLASNRTSVADVDLSVAFEAETTSVIACPIAANDASSASVDVLYAIFPPHLGSGDWLALISLACRQYQQADAVWAARKQAEAHAVIESDLERAREIQMRLLPKLTALPRLDVAIGFLPCRWVGGDYVDVIQMPDGRALLTVADVAGKGTAAALVAFGVFTAVRAAVAAGMSQGGLAGSLDTFICDMLGDESYVTMIAVALDPVTGRMESVNAGHPRPFIVGRQGGLRRLDATGALPMGVNGGALPVDEDQLHAGELLILFTDGLTESFNAEDKMLDEDGLGRLLLDVWRSDGNLNLSDVGRELSARLDAWQGPRGAEDDRTFLLATRM